MITTYAERTPQKPNATDAAAERETVIVWSDADQVIHISTSQRPMITSLKNNPSAKLLEVSEDVHTFELPLGLITVRKGKRQMNKAVTRKGRPSGITLCGEPTAKGTPCQGIAKKDTGKCAKHS
jgi:hypothetical protein